MAVGSELAQFLNEEQLLNVFFLPDIAQLYLELYLTWSTLDGCTMAQFRAEEQLLNVFFLQYIAHLYLELYLT